VDRETSHPHDGITAFREGIQRTKEVSKTIKPETSLT
jgi:hypothetical protein